MSTVKQAMTPAAIEESGLLSLWGAEFEFPTADFVIDAVVRWAKRALYAYTVEDEAFLELVRSWLASQRGWGDRAGVDSARVRHHLLPRNGHAGHLPARATG